MESITPVISISLSVSGIVGLIIYIIYASMQFGALQLKVDTMWAFQIRRAMTEVTTSGIGKMESPIKFKQEVIDNLAPVKDELIAFYQKSHQIGSDAEMLLAIEEKFGTQILQLICVPCNITHGACLLAAYAVASGQKDGLDIKI